MPNEYYRNPTYQSYGGNPNYQGPPSGLVQFDQFGGQIGASGVGNNMGALQIGGAITAVFGAVSSALGTYYQAESAKNQYKSQALNEKFQSQMSAINARGAEFGAQQSLMSNQKEIGRYTMGAGQAKSSAKAAMAARGLQAGVGSSAEAIASMNLIKEIDVLTMSSKSVRQAEAIRTQAQNYRNQSVMSGLSAANLNTTAGTINPYVGLSTSLLTSASDIGMNWVRNNRIEQFIAAQSTARF